MSRRLLWPFAASITLHAAVFATYWLAPFYYDIAPSHSRRDDLRVTLRPVITPVQLSADPMNARPGDSKPVTAGTVMQEAPPQPSEEASTTKAPEVGITTAPRFVSPPNFESIANYPVELRFRMRFMLFVSETGRVRRVEVMESGPIPSDLRDLIVSALYNARMIPAYENGLPVSAKTELVVGASSESLTTNRRAPVIPTTPLEVGN